MKKLSRILVFSILAVFLVAGSALAVTFGDGGAALQGVLDGITTAPVAGSSSVDVNADQLSDSLDSHWSITATGGSWATIIIELAGYAPNNLFGVYDAANPSNVVEVFDGPSILGDQATLSIKLDGSVWVNLVDTGVDFAQNLFGYYLDSSYYHGDGLFYSDTGLNLDGMDHMAAYQGKNIDTVQLPGLPAGLWTNNEYVLAFEDQYGGGDRDYTDFVVMVESVNPVPEPATMFLLGSGLIGLAGLGRRKFFNKK